MRRRAKGRARVRAAVLLAALAGLVSLPASAASPTVAGTWAVTDSCTAGWCAGQSFPSTWTLTVSGATVTGRISDGEAVAGTTSGASASWTLTTSGYSASMRVTVSAGGTSWSGTWSDSRHASGTTAASRTGASPGGTAGAAGQSADDTGCVGGCDNLAYDVVPALDPDPGTIVAGVGCGGASAPRATASAAADGGCDDTILFTTPNKVDTADLTEFLNSKVDLSKVVDQSQAKQMERWQLMQKTQSDIDAIENEAATPAAARAGDAAKTFQQWQNYEEGGSSPSSNQLPDVDSTLSPDFPEAGEAGTRLPASALASAPRPASAAAVLRSIYEPKPTRAEIRAFDADLTLATAPSYSPARAEARLTLVVAVLLGHAVLTRELGFDPFHAPRSARIAVLASAHAHLSSGGTARLTLRPTALGGRILRLLSFLGIAHRTTIALAVAVDRNGVEHRANVSVRIR
jgi:hypothetical protein